ncbi:Mo-dependent nitrogenase C-terminal domain-containing protein [Spirulina subsalsa FACHB-351]|uniref:Mo-dependent nitrogenase C-terminal domain-containing protein n=1 Tax=Spirulina subsalsa FACHB-351 TaxID=234711 RepID=A0ABT3L7W6_9CYAN|nr:Mo-dependent nitrogenase C-terminal domain-containing protein [Spirulina subsalsa]MCW6037593.1 Mo-dependent nitrogenase C-terminal domain-containing protein [Spirulina subsalsa FACHB-351]
MVDVTGYTIKQIILSSWTTESTTTTSAQTTPQPFGKKPQFDLLYPLKQWMDNLDIKNVKLAHWICHWIPAQCPFERDIKLFGKTLFHIPPLCKLNPFYEQFVSLRFRALCYLADECGEDISAYC